MRTTTDPALKCHHSICTVVYVGSYGSARFGLASGLAFEWERPRGWLMLSSCFVCCVFCVFSVDMLSNCRATMRWAVQPDIDVLLDGDWLTMAVRWFAAVCTLR